MDPVDDLQSGQEPVETEPTEPQLEASESEATPAPSTPELTAEQLVDQVRKKFEAGEIDEKNLSFADRKFQSAFSKRLNGLRENVDQVGQKLAAAGIKLPEGKTMYDLLSENGGQGFTSLMSSVVDGAIAPIKDRISKADQEQSVRSQIAIAQSQYPEVKKHFAKAVEIVDSNPDLQEAGLVQGGRYLPYVLAGVAKDLELNEAKTKMAEMAKTLEKAGLAAKVGSKTSHATGKPVADGERKPRSLAEIASQIWDKTRAELPS